MTTTSQLPDVGIELREGSAEVGNVTCITRRHLIAVSAGLGVAPVADVEDRGNRR